MDERLDKLLAVVEQQHAVIAKQHEITVQQSEQIALLTQSVAMLLGEQLGVPVPDDAEQESARTDMDGVPY